MKKLNHSSSVCLKSVCLRSVVTAGVLCCLTVQATCVRADSAAYQTALKSTVWVLAKTGGETSSGTGVLVDVEKKLVITNFHVVGEARAAVIFFPDFKNEKADVTRKHYLDNVKTLGIRGRVLSVDRKRDLALVELDRIPEGATAIPMAAESCGPGENVESIGNPGTTEALWVYTSGTVRSVYQKTFRTGAGEHEFKVVETQAPINSGDSGGPVLNSKGELTAIAQAIAPNARLVSYSVDISEVKTFMASPWKPAPIPASDLLEKADLKYTSHKSGHLEVEFDEKDAGKQSVFITTEVEYYERADVRKIWTLAATLKQTPNAETMMKLLEQNARTKLGGWMIEKNEKSEFMLLYCVKMDATASPDAVKSTMEYVAKLTRTAKKELLPKEEIQTASQTLDSWLAK
ncbi:MAG: trypsin-like peptidase domain-containing protein [Fuerstia sp.]|nr:trypsin-like peptidase domain-containing protein [Fuerstiella sp.]